MNEYTAEDFTRARFAEHPDTGEVAMRNRPDRPAGPWESNIGHYTDEDMADLGFRPVREAAPLSLAALREAWDAAEVITPDNRPRKGDELIKEIEACNLRVFKAYRDGDSYSPGYRILRRGPRRPEGAEELEGLIDRAPYPRICGVDAELADWLAERGVRVVSSDE